MLFLPYKYEKSVMIASLLQDGTTCGYHPIPALDERPVACHATESEELQGEGVLWP
jgi:hypothetical protein